MATQERVEVLRGHPGDTEVVVMRFALASTSDLNISDNAHYLLASQSEEEGGNNGFIILWELDQNGKQLSPKANTLAATANEQTDKLRFPGELGSFGSPIFSPDNQTMVYLTPNERGVGPFQCSEYDPVINLWDIESRSLRHQLSGHTDAVMWIGISPDSLLAASISWDSTARIWNTSSGNLLHTLGPFDGQLWCGAVSPDSRYLAINEGSSENTIVVYEIATEQMVAYINNPTWVCSMAWSPDGTSLAGGLDIGALYLWDPYTGMEQRRWRLGLDSYMMQSYETIGGIQFIEGGQKLIFRILEGTVEVYDFKTNLKQQFTRREEDKISKCPISEMVCSGGSTLVVPDADGVLRFWSL